MDFLLYLALVPTLGFAAQWIAWRTSLPGILLLLLFGVLLGQLIVQPSDLFEQLTGDAAAEPKLLFPIVSLAVAVIMFEGGLTLKLGELREAGSAAFRLCTAGAAITFVGAAVAAHYVLGFEWRLSWLLGAVLVVTGPTVIGPLLRQVRPSRRVSNTLKWEGIVIDPIGAILAVLVFDQLMVAEDASALHAMTMLGKTILVGGGLGIAGGYALSIALRRFWVPDNLHGVAALSVGLMLFALSNHFAHESGLITVTIMGIWLTNQHNLDIEHIIEFKEHLRTLLIGCLFIVLGSRVNLDDIAAIGIPGVLFVLALILVVRPLSVFGSMIGSSLNFREQSFVAGLAPRGIVAAAVSSVFALELEHGTHAANIPGADQLATVTFFVIVGTVAVYGVAANPLAKWLNLADEKSNGVLIAGADAWVRDFAAELKGAGLPILLVDTNYNKVAQAKIGGLNAVCANILNEHVREELDLAGIGQMMAMTQNDEVNSLAVRECRTMFDRAQLYQLSFDTANLHARRGLTKNLMGRALFADDLTFSQMKDLHSVGARFKATTLSEEFTYEDYLERYQGGTNLLCVLDENNSLSVNTVGDPLAPVAGQTIISLVSSTVVPEEQPPTAA